MKCPTCDQPVTWQGNPYRPFCSERCKLVDLGRWVNEEYRVPGETSNQPPRTDLPATSATAADDDPID